MYAHHLQHLVARWFRVWNWRVHHAVRSPNAYRSPRACRYLRPRVQLFVLVGALHALGLVRAAAQQQGHTQLRGNAVVRVRCSCFVWPTRTCVHKNMSPDTGTCAPVAMDSLKCWCVPARITGTVAATRTTILRMPY